MCGLCGILTFDNETSEKVLSDAVSKMAKLMRRRGPDDQGFWNDPQGRLFLGFQRLSILDLSPSGHQPMVSPDGSSALVFNGEIYNYKELGKLLQAKGIVFHSSSDTEVLLQSLNYWKEEAIDKLNGMFAFGWYDMVNKKLLIARDHAGIKPLYYFIHPQKKAVAFGSQFNTLLHTPWGRPGKIRESVLRLYLQLHHIPAPYGLLENTFQVEPGCYVEFNSDRSIRHRRWWEYPRHPKPDLEGKQARAAVSEALDNAVRRQRRSDVPLGVFLSGGVDSPLVTSSARSQTGPELKAFTIGNPGWEQDEAEVAAEYGRHLDVDSQVYNLTGDDAVNAIPDIIKAQHEPFADFSIIPTLLLSRFARQQVTVVLSGDGGDELFFGYERPLSLLRNGSDFRWSQLFRMALYGAGQYGLGKKRSAAIVYKTPGHYYFDVNCRVKSTDLSLFAPDLGPLPSDFKLYTFGSYVDDADLANYSRWVEYYGQMQRCLKKVDMASMHHSLEVRVPLLDREVVEVSARINPFDNMKNGRRKAVLTDLLAERIPPKSIPGDKKGFAVPLGEWLKSPLRGLVENTLFSSSSIADDFFDKKGLQRYWEQTLSGEKSNKWGIWTILSFKWWANRNLS